MNRFFITVRMAALAAAGFLLMCGGCAGITQLIDPPEMFYLGMTVQRDSMFEATPAWRFHLLNQNPKALRVTGIAYDLKINHRKFVKGVAGQEVRISPYGEAELDLPVSFNYLDLFQTVSEFSQADRIAYDLTVSLIIPPFSIPYHTEGELMLPEAPQVSVSALTLRRIAPEAADLDLTVRLSNANDFDILIDGMDLTVLPGDMSRDSAMSARLPQPLSLAADATAERMIPVTVPLDGKDAAFQDWLTPGERNHTFSGRFTFRIPGRDRRMFPFEGEGVLTLRDER